mmetsp:Transcript_3015/g.6881  ORF Transcript_3015/g.6881 Transcript_3015/m.6881 type:complete len:220 (+) Transcript_3015:651-1310(+)
MVSSHQHPVFEAALASEPSQGFGRCEPGALKPLQELGEILAQLLPLLIELPGILRSRLLVAEISAVYQKITLGKLREKVVQEMRVADCHHPHSRGLCRRLRRYLVLGVHSLPGLCLHKGRRAALKSCRQVAEWHNAAVRLHPLRRQFIVVPFNARAPQSRAGVEGYPDVGVVVLGFCRTLLSCHDLIPRLRSIECHLGEQVEHVRFLGLRAFDAGSRLR